MAASQPRFVSEWGFLPQARFENDMHVSKLLHGKVKHVLGEITRQSEDPEATATCSHPVLRGLIKMDIVVRQLWVLHSFQIPCLWEWSWDVDQTRGGRETAPYFRATPRALTSEASRADHAFLASVVPRGHVHACEAFEAGLQRLHARSKFYPFKRGLPRFPVRGYWGGGSKHSRRVFVDCAPTYFAEAFRRFVRLPADVRHSYVRWCVACAFPTFAEFYFPWAKHTQHVQGLRDAPPFSYVVVRTIEEHVPMTLNHLLQSTQPQLSVSQLNAWKNWTQHLLGAFRKRLQPLLNRFPSRLRQRIGQKFQRLKVLLGYPTTHEPPLELSPERQQCFSCSLMELAAQEKRFRANHATSLAWGVLGSFEARAMFAVRANQIVVPAGLLRVFPKGPPRPGTDEHIRCLALLGRALAHELGHTFDPFALQFDARGRYRPMRLDATYGHWVKPVFKLAKQVRSRFTTIAMPSRASSEQFADWISMLLLTPLVHHRPEVFAQSLRLFVTLRWTPPRARHEWATNPHGSGDFRLAFMQDVQKQLVQQ